MKCKSNCTLNQLVCFVALLLMTIEGTSQTAKVLQPTEEIHLSRFGYVDPDPNVTFREGGLLRHMVGFDSRGRIIASYMAHKHPGLVIRNEPAFSLNIVQIDQNTQTKIVDASVVATGWADNALYVTAQDKVLVQTDHSLTLLSSALKPVAIKPVDGDHGYLWSVLEAKDNKTALTIAQVSGKTTVESIDLETLRVIQSCHYARGRGQISDVNAVGETVGEDSVGLKPEIFVGPHSTIDKIPDRIRQ